MNKAFYVLVMCAMLLGCKSVQYVPVETVRTDSIYVSSVERDSIYMLDSIYIKEKGDTFWIEKWRVKYVERLSRDTVWKERVDSIQVPYPVEKELSRWQKLKLDMGGIALGALLLTIAAAAVWIARKLM